jgi:hypothetical protein
MNIDKEFAQFKLKYPTDAYKRVSEFLNGLSQKFYLDKIGELKALGIDDNEAARKARQSWVGTATEKTSKDS